MTDPTVDRIVEKMYDNDDLAMFAPTVTLMWCPECGRDDRWTNLKPKHYWVGKLCPGAPVKLRYSSPEVKS